MQYLAANLWNDPGYYTVAGHGHPSVMLDDRPGSTNDFLWANVLAQMIMADPLWMHRPVKLGGCHTGAAWEDGHAGVPHWQPYGQMLANYLGVPVTASDEFTQWSPQSGLAGTHRGNGGLSNLRVAGKLSSPTMFCVNKCVSTFSWVAPFL